MAHLRVEWPHQGAPFISCHSSRPSSQWHIVDSNTDAMPWNVDNIVRGAFKQACGGFGIW